MARRGHHLTEVALLASASGCLAAAGAGEREGWLDDPAVLLSLGPRARDLAVASAARSVLGIVPVAGGGGVTVVAEAAATFIADHGIALVSQPSCLAHLAPPAR